MRRIVLAIAGTISGLVLVFSYPTSLNKTQVASTALGSDGAGATTDSATADSSSDGSASDGTTTTAPVTATYTGGVVETRFGPVQVEITVTDATVTDAVATQYPSDDSKSLQINAYALPTLESETLSAQSSSIDLVSGATITSNAYVQSLQSALDQAPL